jgi:hypothetical protein
MRPDQQDGRSVENHMGCLDGLATPDSSGDGILGWAARHAAATVLARELARRADALASAPEAAIALKPNGRIVWAGAEIAELERGDTALKPRLRLYADEHLAGPERERVQKRLDAWLASELDARLKPLIALSEASDISGLARGLAFRLTENLGVLRRDTAADEVKALDQEARGQLRKYGVRFGASTPIPSFASPLPQICSRCPGPVTRNPSRTPCPRGRNRASPLSRREKCPSHTGAPRGSMSRAPAPSASTCWSACRTSSVRVSPSGPPREPPKGPPARRVTAASASYPN